MVLFFVALLEYRNWISFFGGKNKSMFHFALKKRDVFAKTSINS